MEPSIKNLLEAATTMKKRAETMNRTERLLAELRFFVHFNKVFGAGDEALVRHLFKVSHCVTPTPVSDSVLLTVQNATTDLIFNHEHWSFLVQKETHGTRFGATFTLGRSLTPGDSETVNFDLPQGESFDCVHFKITVSFRFEYGSRKFERQFPCGEIDVDVLNRLSPTRRLGVIPCRTVGINVLQSIIGFGSDVPKVPPSVRMELKGNQGFCTQFRTMLLKESRHRGFSACAEDELVLTSFVGTEEIRVEFAKEKVIVRTFSEPLLAAVKSAVLKRLEMVERVELKCPGDPDLEALYHLKLEIGVEHEEFDVDEGYVRLRTVTQGIGFNVKS